MNLTVFTACNIMHPDAKYGKNLAFEGIMVAELKLKESADHKLVLI